MKKIVFVFAFLLTISFQINAQWFWQNPLPMSESFYDVTFIDENNGWAVGNSGAILRSTDGGLNWVILDYVTDESLKAIDFSDINNGWIVGRQGSVLKTTDGGLTWNIDSLGSNYNLTNIQFIDNNIGWISALDITNHKGLIFKTTDSGSNWLIKYDEPI